MFGTHSIHSKTVKKSLSLLNEVRRWPGGYQYLKEQVPTYESNVCAIYVKNHLWQAYFIDIIRYISYIALYYRLTLKPISSIFL
jgi:hypothetical protein